MIADAGGEPLRPLHPRSSFFTPQVPVGVPVRRARVAKSAGPRSRSGGSIAPPACADASGHGWIQDYSCRGVSSWADPIRRQNERGNDPHRSGGVLMGQYLLSTYAVEGEVPGAPRGPEEMKAFMERVVALEDEMEATGTFLFGGALHDPDAATVLRSSEGDVVMTDGPFVEVKE